MLDSIIKELEIKAEQECDEIFAQLRNKFRVYYLRQISKFPRPYVTTFDKLILLRDTKYLQDIEQQFPNDETLHTRIWDI